MAQPESALDISTRSDAGPTRRWRSVLGRAAGLALLCNAIPLADAGYTWFVVEHRSGRDCVECGVFDGLVGGAPGLLLSARTVLQELSWQLGLIVGG